MDRLLEALHREGAEDPRRQDGRASFRVPWTVTFGPLWGITRGTLSLETGGLRYFLSLRRGCLTIALAVLVWVGFEVLWMGPSFGLAAFRGLVVWLCLWAAAYWWVAWRFRGFLRRALAVGGAPPAA